MKARPFRAPRLLVESAAQLRAALRGFWFRARGHWWSLPSVMALSGILWLIFFPVDSALLTLLHALYPGQDEIARRVAWYFGTFGDYPTYNLPLSLGIWLYGFVAKKSVWRRLALVCFLGGTLAGVLDDCFRLTLGRPRPDADMVDGFYGLPDSLRDRCQSFPSGHAAAVFGASTALLIVARPLGMVTTLYSLLVIWARMELNRHYPSDVVVGALLGIWLGLLVGRGAKAPWSRLARPRLRPATARPRIGHPLPAR
jgi:undecaprenyl-diphosphatase